MPGGSKKGGGLEYTPFEMRGEPFKRNFGIGETEALDTEGPLNFNLGNALANVGSKINMNVQAAGGWGKVASKALSAGLRTLPGGYDATQSTNKKDDDEELSTDDLLKDFKDIDPTALSADQKAVYDKIMKGE